MSLQSVFTHVTSIYANLLDKREEFIFHWIGLRHQHGRSLFQAFRRWWEAVRSEVEGGLGRAVRVPSLSSLPPPPLNPSLVFIFSRSSLLLIAPVNLNAWNRLTWPPFHCFGAPIWKMRRHTKTLYEASLRD